MNILAVRLKDVVRHPVSLVLVVAFLIRVVVLHYVTRGVIHFTLYDVGIYIDFGKNLFESLMKCDVESAAGVNVGTPPFGMLLTGLSIYTFGKFIGEIEASIFPQVIASSLTVIPVYLLARRFSERAGILASLIYAADPYLVQFSFTYLDPIGTLLVLLAILLCFRGPERRNLIVSGLLLGLASLTKLTFLIFMLIYSVLLILIKRDKKYLLILSVAAPLLLLIPWLWFPEARAQAVVHHLSFNSYMPMVFVGPEIIGVPHAHAWYILSYIGMGQVFWNTLPFITPLILLLVIIFCFFRGRLVFPLEVSVAAASMVLTIFLLPRNYWTYSWSGGVIQGVLVRQYYPYYFYPVGPFLAVLAAVLMHQYREGAATSRIITYPILLTSLVSPMAVVMNLGFPYWDFIFTLIYSLSAGSWVIEGTAAMIITIAMLTVLLIISEILHRAAIRDSKERRRILLEE